MRKWGGLCREEGVQHPSVWVPLPRNLLLGGGGAGSARPAAPVHPTGPRQELADLCHKCSRVCPSVCVHAALAKAAPPEPHGELKKGGPEEVAAAGPAYPQLQRQHQAPAHPHPPPLSSSLHSSGCASSHHPTGPARQGPQGQPHHHDGQESLHLQAQGRAPPPPQKELLQAGRVQARGSMPPPRGHLPPQGGDSTQHSEKGPSEAGLRPPLS